MFADILAHAPALADWDSFGLNATRIAMGAAAWWCVIVCYRLLQIRPDRQVTVIPRPIVRFAMFWNIVLGIYTILLVLGDVEAIRDGLPRTVYGMAIAWALFGMAWIVSRGARKSSAALDVVEALDDAVKAANEKMDREQ